MNKSLLLCLVLLCAVTVSATDLSKEYNRTFETFLVEKIHKLPKGAMVEVFFKDGTSIVGTYLNYQEYDSSVWIRPVGSNWGWLSEDAYDTNQIEDIRVKVVSKV